MFAIGDFARHGRVSVRMLRHYDAIGLLRPAYVDPVTGYRSYEAGQFVDLNRIVALKDLGFSLEQVRTLIADEITPAELRALLTMRRAELESTVAESFARLAQVESRAQPRASRPRTLAPSSNRCVRSSAAGYRMRRSSQPAV